MNLDSNVWQVNTWSKHQLYINFRLLLGKIAQPRNSSVSNPSEVSIHVQLKTEKLSLPLIHRYLDTNYTYFHYGRGARNFQTFDAIL